MRRSPHVSESTSANLRVRPDLVFQTVQSRDSAEVVVKDPLSLNYYRLRQDEAFVLRRLDGQTDLTIIRNDYNQRFAPQTTSLQELQTLLYRFHEAELITSAATNQTSELLRRYEQAQRQKWLQRWAGILFVRFPGWRPEPFLQRTYPLVGWLFSPWVVVIGLSFVLVAVVWLAVHWSEFVRRLPSADEFFAGQQIWGWMLVIGITKILHELGHAYACRRCGGECHEIGPMLLVFTPALYCDTSDAWLTPNKWHRAAIGLAGIYVELLIAAGATFIWWNTHSSYVHFASLKVMTVCSISALLINGNPLLRYDGYYVLSDLMNEPNLSAAASRQLWRNLQSLTLGIRDDDHAKEDWPRLLRLNVYAAAAFCYRWFVFLGILFLLTRWLRPRGLAVLGYAVGAVSLLGMAIVPSQQIMRWFERPYNLQRLRTGRVMTSAVLLTATIFFVLNVPIPTRVHTEGSLHPEGAIPVYVTTPGFVTSAAPARGNIVNAGDALIHLKNQDIAWELAVAEATCEQQTQTLNAFRQLQIENPQMSRELPALETALATARRRWELVQRREKALTITAPANGRLLPATDRRAETRAGELGSWSGQLTDESNLGAYLETGTHAYWIAAGDDWEFVTRIPVAKVGMIQKGNHVNISARATPSIVFRGTVIDVARQSTPSTEGDGDQTTSYFATKIALTGGPQHRLLPGMRASALITTRRQTLWQRARRGLASVLRSY